ncbi:sensor histidine kinase [Sulfuricurvum sp.]|uniref:sensor histidine kinase n=1 Tax=Sulfuricurvum sp. TaxID=2025608 RepID=UPI0026204377|nr:sensor histidine kinase [Sulfuricurvum sp.]MDD3596638.1 sensor histidine kinase [Sulfuricurvum sp.]
MKIVLLIFVFTISGLFGGLIGTDKLSEIPSNTLLFFYGISTGIVLMAAIYNAVLFIYNRQIMFLYYTMMQVTVVFSLLYLTNILHNFHWFIDLEKIAHIFTNLGAVFAILFTRTFLQTKKNTPIFDKFLILLLLILSLDFILLILGQTNLNDLIPCIGLMGLLLIVGIIRYYQGFTPALYYSIGWSILIASIELNINFKVDPNASLWETVFLSNPLLIGSPLEAIILALGLFYTVKQSENEKKIQEFILVQQAKLAYLGEMLGNISHQWRQPLTNLSYIFMNINASHNEQITIQKKVDEGLFQLQFMSETIENFHNFQRPDVGREEFSLYDETSYALSIIQNELDHHNIHASIRLFQDTCLLNFKNQYIQVLLNIIGNAKEALIALNLQKKYIHIEISKNTVKIKDNAGGIPKNLLTRIFEPYFSTKPHNSGIGLYMSKIIIEKNMAGILAVSNTDEGACFELKF